MKRTFPRRSSTSNGATPVPFVSDAMMCSPSVAARRAPVGKTLLSGRSSRSGPTSALAQEETRAVGILLDRGEERVTGEATPRGHAKPRGGIVDAHLEDLTALERAHAQLHLGFEAATRLAAAVERRIGD